MARQDIDELIISVQSDASNASKNLNSLTKRLSKLGETINAINTANITNTTKSLTTLNTTLQNLKSEPLRNITSSLKSLSNLNTENLKNSTKNIKEISNALKGFSGITIPNLNGIATLTNNLRTLGNKSVTQATKNLPSITNDLSNFVSSLNSVGSLSFDPTNLSMIINSVSKLGGAKVTQAATQNLPNIARDLTNFIQQLNKIQTVDFDVSKFTALTESIRKLGLSSASKAVPNIEALAKAIKNMMLTLKEAPQVSNNLIRMTNAVANLASQGQRVVTATRGIVNGIHSTGSAASSNESKIKSFASAIGKLYAQYWLLLRVFKGFWYTLTKSMDFMETVNYFEVAMAQIGEEAMGQWQEMGYASAEAYADSFAERAKQLTEKMTGYRIDTEGNATLLNQKSLGLDPDQVLQYQAMYAQMANSIGLTEETALNASKALVMLGTDWSSLRNIALDDAWQKFASALAGQTRAVRALGIDITQATLQEYAYKYGLDQSIMSMNQAAKTQLRLLAILDQSKVAYGDLANTISSPANQVRVLQQNLVNLARTFGNLFIGVFAKVIPYINAVVILLQRLFQWIAGILGIQLQGINTSIGGMTDEVSGLIDETDDMASGVGDVSDGFEDAADSAKDLGKAMGSLPFDELHTFTQEQASAGAGGAGAGAVGGVGDMGMSGIPALDEAIANALNEYQEIWDEAFKNMNNRAQELADTLQSLVPIIAGIGAGLLALKLAPGLISSLNKVKTLMQAINAWGTKSALKGLFLQAGSAITQMLPGLAKITPAMAGWAVAIGLVAGHYTHLYQESKVFRKGLETTGKVVKKVFNEVGLIFKTLGGILADVFGGMWQGIKDIFASFDIDLSFLDPIIEGFENFIKGLDLDLSDLGVTIAGVGALIAGLTIPGAQFLVPIGAFMLAAEGLSVALRTIGYWTSDAVQQVEIFGDDISDVTKQKVEPFVNEIQGMQRTLDSVYFDAGGIIDEEDFTAISTSLDTIVNMITTELDADKNQALADLNPLKNLMSAENYQGAIEGINTYYEQLKTQVTTNEGRINEIVATAKAEQRNLTAEEYAEIARLQEEMSSTGIQQLSQNEIEQETIMRRLKDNSTAISAEQAEKIIADAKRTKDEAINNAENQYSEVVLNAERMREAGIINDEEYNSIIAAAQTAKADAITAAEEQYQGIYDTAAERFPETTKFIDRETGEMKTKWEVAREEMEKAWDNFFKGLDEGAAEGWKEVTTWWDTTKTNWKKDWETFRSDLEKKWDGFWNGLDEGAKTGWDAFNKWWEERKAFWKKDWEEFTNGLKDGWNKFWSFLKDPFGSEDAENVGKNIGEGAAEGLNNAKTGAGPYVYKTLDEMKAAAIIRSPSKLFRDEVGAYIGEGIAVGLVKSTSSVVKAAKGIIDEVRRVFNGVEYSLNVDYAALIEEAKKLGDLDRLSLLEQQRNAKIMGEHLSYVPTWNYNKNPEQEKVDEEANKSLENINENILTSIDEQTKITEGIDTLKTESVEAINELKTANEELSLSLNELVKNVSYDKNVDYAALMAKAKAEGDYEKLAELEMQRNAKIQGEHLNYAPTFDYQNLEKATKETNTSLTSIDTSLKTAYENDLDTNSSVTDIAKLLKDFLKDMFETVKNGFAQSHAMFNDFTAMLTETLDQMITAIRGIEINVYQTVGGKAYAAGGFVEDGLFFANRGELVGKFSNGRTAVANNEQIIEGIRQGVYDAVSAAMRNADNGGTVIENILKLDNEVIYKGQQKVAKKRGYNFDMGKFNR